jgi:hypothetical protein
MLDRGNKCRAIPQTEHNNNDDDDDHTRHGAMAWVRMIYGMTKRWDAVRERHGESPGEEQPS